MDVSENIFEEAIELSQRIEGKQNTHFKIFYSLLL